MVQKHMIKNKRLAVYTAIIGDYDEIKDPKIILKNCDYICFTNNKNMNSNVWKFKYYHDNELDNTRMARKIKILPYDYLTDYRYTLWIDANIEININLNDFINLCFDGRSMTTLSHPLRDCVYDEALACINRNKDSFLKIYKQMKYYKKKKYPKNNGLIASRIIYRDMHCLNTKKVMESWWREVLYNSRRDQLSFNYVSWSHGFKYSALDINVEKKNSCFILHKHKNSIKKSFLMRFTAHVKIWVVKLMLFIS